MTPRLQHVYSPSAPVVGKDLTRTPTQVHVRVPRKGFKARHHFVNTIAWRPIAEDVQDV